MPSQTKSAAWRGPGGALVCGVRVRQTLVVLKSTQATCAKGIVGMVFPSIADDDVIEHWHLK
jgi:hypothetical protein